jgi:hypothetical protein
MPLLVQRTDAHAINRLAAFATNSASLGMIMLLAVRLTLNLEELAIRKRLGTSGTVEVLAMPMFAQSFNRSAIADGSMTFGTGKSEELIVVLQTVGIFVLLVELSILKHRMTNGAIEALLVKVLVQCLQVAPLDALEAARALGQVRLLVADDAIRLVVSVEKLIGADLVSASIAGKASMVIQSSQHLQRISLDFFAAHSASHVNVEHRLLDGLEHDRLMTRSRFVKSVRSSFVKSVGFAIVIVGHFALVDRDAFGGASSLFQRRLVHQRVTRRRRRRRTIIVAVNVH